MWVAAGGVDLPSVDAERAKVMLDRESYKVLDIRYDGPSAL